jgi:hypothetical protein
LTNINQSDENDSKPPSPDQGACESRPGSASRPLNREFFILEKDGIPVAGLMHVDDLEDYLEMQNRSVKEQIQTSTAEYRRGAARSAHEFLAELKTPSSKRKKK